MGQNIFIGSFKVRYIIIKIGGKNLEHFWLKPDSSVFQNSAGVSPNRCFQDTSPRLQTKLYEVTAAHNRRSQTQFYIHVKMWNLFITLCKTLVFTYTECLQISENDAPVHAGASTCMQLSASHMATEKCIRSWRHVHNKHENAENRDLRSWSTWTVSAWFYALCCCYMVVWLDAATAWMCRYSY